MKETSPTLRVIGVSKGSLYFLNECKVTTDEGLEFGTIDTNKGKNFSCDQMSQKHLKKEEEEQNFVMDRHFQDTIKWNAYESSLRRKYVICEKNKYFRTNLI